MASPYWKWPAHLDGRLEPQNGVAEDGDYVFCLGDDNSEPPVHMLELGDQISVSQAFVLPAHRLIRFGWYMRSPAGMTEARTVLSAGTASMVLANTVTAGDALIGLRVDNPQTSLFQTSDGDQYVDVAGFANAGNNGQFRISAVPVHPDIAVPNSIAIVENGAAVAEAGAVGVTIGIYGLQWIARGYINGILRAELMEPVGHPTRRSELAMHVSKLLGASTIMFTLELGLVSP